MLFVCLLWHKSVLTLYHFLCQIFIFKNNVYKNLEELYDEYL